MTLGELIHSLTHYEADMRVTFDFAGFQPTTFDSWRGIYAELALGYSDAQPYPGMTVGKLLKAARAADGATFVGYKGGDFVMSKKTPVWVDNYGEYHRTGIDSISTDGGTVIIHTAYRDGW